MATTPGRTSGPVRPVVADDDDSDWEDDNSDWEDGNSHLDDDDSDRSDTDWDSNANDMHDGTEVAAVGQSCGRCVPCKRSVDCGRCDVCLGKQKGNRYTNGHSACRMRQCANVILQATSSQPCRRAVATVHVVSTQTYDAVFTAEPASAIETAPATVKLPPSIVEPTPATTETAPAICELAVTIESAPTTVKADLDASAAEPSTEPIELNGGVDTCRTAEQSCCSEELRLTACKSAPVAVGQTSVSHRTKLRKTRRAPHRRRRRRPARHKHYRTLRPSAVNRSTAISRGNLDPTYCLQQHPSMPERQLKEASYIIKPLKCGAG